MPKYRLTRNLIHIISRNSNWPATNINRALTENVYAGRKTWNGFLNLFLLSLGVGFAVSGVIFFFAYNWDDMHKFAKMGIAGALLVACVVVGICIKTSRPIRGTVLTGAALLVGGLFALFGQVYQTGADSWELFFIWAVFIAAWVAVSSFTPLWLIFLTLINTTLTLYWIQSVDADYIILYELLFAIDAGFVIVCEVLSRQGLLRRRPGWLIVVVSLFATAIITIGIIIGIFDRYNTPLFMPSLILPLAVFALGITYGINAKNTFYPTVISFSVIAILSALLIKLVDEPVAATLLAGIFIIGSIAILTHQIIRLNKQWHGKK